MTNFLVIFACLVAGWLCRRSERFPADSFRALNSFVLFISLPALIFTQFPALLAGTALSGDLLVPVLMPWVIIFSSWAIFSRMSVPRATAGALILTAGLGNTSFVGFPLLEALLGPQSLRYGILIDQFGSFLSVSLVGIPLAAYYAGTRVKVSEIARRVVLFPPFIAILLACGWYALGLPGEGVLMLGFERVSMTLVPLAMFAVGFQLRLEGALLKRRGGILALGLGYKMLLAPFVVWLVCRAFDLAPELTGPTVLEAGMAPMITAAIVVSEMDLDSELANLMVAVGIPLSLITVPLWAWFIG